ncbi:MAG: AraC family transcriptional regulator [Spirochaetia bacterium]|nr:AraC family transcriptional regulator [Spirochaetia bacterium]
MKKTRSIDIQKIKSFVGEIEENELTFVEKFVSEDMAVFMPAGGYCGYSITKDHVHPTVMFTVHFDDLGMIELNGEVFSSKPNTIFFLRENMPHHELISKRPSRFLALFVPFEFLQKIAALYNRSFKDLAASNLFSTPPRLLDSIKVFTEEVKNEAPGKKDIIYGISLRITHILIRMLFEINLDQSKKTETITENFHVNQTIDYIYKNLSKKITVEELASIAHLSVSHFSQIFRRETKESPHRYLLITRLNQSQRLIKEGKLNFTEIAYECGFSSSSHFAAAFQKEFSISPSDFRKKSGF